MKRINAPLASHDTNAFNTIINKSRKPYRTRLISIQTQVASAITRYRQSLFQGAFCSFFVVDESVRDAYYKLYDSKSKDVVKHKEEILSLFGNDLCPYCQLSETEDLDHFLPRSVFPELSISSQNLVPSCGLCNRKYKGTSWGNGSNQPFLHPYFNYLPSVQYLQCNVLIEDGSLITNFYIVHPFTINHSVVDHIQRHFTTLDLNFRYIRKVSSEEVPKILRLLNSAPDIPSKHKVLTDFVALQLTANEINTWGHAFYSALIPGLINNICVGI